MTNVQEILKKITYRDEESQGSQSIGTAKEVFADFEFLPVKNSKNNARRASIMMKNISTGQIAQQVLVLSTAATDLFRADKINTDHIAGFPVFYSEDKGFFVGLPSAGWIVVSKIKVKQYKPELTSQDLVDSIA